MANASQGFSTPIRRPLHDLDLASKSDLAFLGKQEAAVREKNRLSSEWPAATWTAPRNKTSTDLDSSLTKPDPMMSTPEMLFKRAPRVQSERKAGPNAVTDFSLSALKNSFSMSSLSHPGAAAAVPAVSTPDVLRTKWERPFFSLTRIRDGSAKKLWRRSWGSGAGSPANSKEDVGHVTTPWQGPEYWPTLQAHYTYLMDCNLIESCRSVNGELTWEDHGLTPKRNEELSHCEDGSPTDEQDIAAPDLQLQLRIVKQWLKKMERRVPDLILRPRWTKETLQQRILEHQSLRREIESRCAEVALLARRCQGLAAAKPAGLVCRVARNLESRYQRLLLKAIEWDYHLETLSNKPPEFFVYRRTAESSDVDSEDELKAKYPRLDESVIKAEEERKHDPAMVMRKESEMGEESFSTTGASPKLAAHSHRRNIAIYDFTHPDTDSEKERETQKRTRAVAIPEFQYKSNTVTSSDEEWVYSNCNSRSNDGSARKKQSPRTHLDFNSEDEHSSGRSWYRYSSSDSDWLQSRDLEMELQLSEAEDVNANVSSNPNQPDSATSLVYDKERVLELANKAEQLVSAAAAAAVADSKGAKPKKRSRKSTTERKLKNDFESEADVEALLDSCDASSELTSGESDLEVDAEMSSRHSSRDSALNRTFTIESVNPPVIMRTRGEAKKAQRPWSLAGLLPVDPAQPGGELAQAAVPLAAASESALNRLLTPTKPFASLHTPKSSPLTRSVATQKDFSSRSWEKMDSGNPRKHRGRHRSHRTRRPDVELLTPTGGSDNNCTFRSGRHSLASSASLSECSSVSSGRRYRAAAKSSAVNLSPSSDKSSRKTTSDVESCKVAPLPADELSSFSAEQAWDNYQERYMSEAYSEDPPDSESARRLLDFGDDYRNFLDSLSDCPSLTPMPQGPSSPSKTRLHPAGVTAALGQGSNRIRRNAVKRSRTFEQRSCLFESGILDSESDVEDLIHVIQTSASQLNIAQITFTKLIHSPKSERSQFAELLATCHTNVDCLQTILCQLELAQQDSDMELPSVEELKAVRELISSWELLAAGVMNHQSDSVQHKEIQQQLVNLRTKLEELSSSIQSSVAAAVSESGEVDPAQALEKLSSIQEQLEQHRVTLLEANVLVHAYTTHCSAAAAAAEDVTLSPKWTVDCDALKSEVAELYKQWDDVQALLQQSEGTVREAADTWQQLQQQLSELQSTLSTDQMKLQNSLAENPDNSNQNSQWSDCRLLQLCSDSGISSGSDGEFISLKEREKRLLNLRKLARKLESILSPGSAALKNIYDTLDKTERDLAALQQTCQKIVTQQVPAVEVTQPQSTVQVRENSAQTEETPLPEVKLRRRKANTNVRTKAELGQALRKMSKQWWWRLARYSAPFYVGLLMLLVFGYFMEPSCCSYANNYNWSFLPKLHYPYGPPPV